MKATVAAALAVSVIVVPVAVTRQGVPLVVDAMTGQDAVNTAKAFNDRLNFDGVVLTKLDGDTRGGAALSVKKVTGKNILFVEGSYLANL